MITLTQFLENELRKYHLPVNKKNLGNLRSRYRRQLGRLRLWDTAEQKVIGRSKTRVFDEEDLINIAHSREIQNYMDKLTKKIALKQSGLTKQEFNKLQAKLNREIDEADEELYKQETFDIDAEIAPSAKNIPFANKQKALHNLMLEAIFSKFFTMTEEQKKQFFEDFAASYWDNEIIRDNPAWTSAQARLTHPDKNYYTERS